MLACHRVLRMEGHTQEARRGLEWTPSQPSLGASPGNTLTLVGWVSAILEWLQKVFVSGLGELMHICEVKTNHA